MKSDKKRRTALEPWGGDVIATLLLAGDKSRFGTFVTVSVLITLLPVLFAVVEGNLSNARLRVDMLHDVGYIEYPPTIVAVLLMLRLYFSKLPSVVRDLARGGAIPSGKLLERSLESSNRKYRSPVVVLVPYVVGATVAIAGRLSYMTGNFNTWNASAALPNGTVAGWVTTLPVFLLYYLIALVFVRMIVTYYALKEVFSHNLLVQPLHPDNCGGLSPLGALSVKLDVGAFLFGVIVTVAIYASIVVDGFPWYHPILIIAVAGYLVGSSFLFFLPLYAVHRSMESAKTELLGVIGRRFQQLDYTLVASIREKKDLEEGSVDQLELLRKLYEFTDRMPVYPFNPKAITGFLASITTPIILFVVQLLISQVIK